MRGEDFGNNVFGSKSGIKSGSVHVGHLLDQRSTGTGTKKPGTFPGTKIFQKLGTGENREPKILNNLERTGTGNIIFENHRERAGTRPGFPSIFVLDSQIRNKKDTPR